LEAVVAAVDDVLHVAAEPVEAEDEAVRVRRVVVVGDLERVLAVLAVDVDGLDAALEGVLPASRGLGGGEAGGRGEADGNARDGGHVERAECGLGTSSE